MQEYLSGSGQFYHPNQVSPEMRESRGRPREIEVDDRGIPGDKRIIGNSKIQTGPKNEQLKPRPTAVTFGLPQKGNDFLLEASLSSRDADFSPVATQQSEVSVYCEFQR